MSATRSATRADDGAALWTYSQGRGPALLLCHGGPGACDTLGGLASLIDDVVTVTRWEQRGCGRSDDLGPFTIDRFVADMEAIRRHIGATVWLVGGHSWGANLALMYAQRHTERVRGLLYICGTGLEWWPTHVEAYHAERRRRWTSEQAARVDELAGKPRCRAEEVELRALQVLVELGGPDDGLAAEIAAEEVAFPVNREVNRALNREQRAIDHGHAIAATEAFTAPTLIIHGGRDPRPVSCTDSLLAALPNGRRVVLPGAGHYPWLEAPEATRAESRSFLRQCSEPSPHR